MRFEVLGPVTVRTEDGTAVAVPEAKVRALLADLLVHHGRPVPVDRLIDDLWGEDLPGNPGNTLQTKVSQLRRTLEGAEPGARGLVAYGPAGYALRVADEAVDAGRFGALVARARDAEQARDKVALLSEALGLWRGDAFADFRDFGFAGAAVARLEEQRLTVREELAELRLELGEHALLADELKDLVAEHPLRERLRGVQLRALYRAGRQSEALDAYRELKERLADELGIDPGVELAGLYEAILRQDPELAPAPVPVLVPGAAGGVRPRSNLPAPVSGLVGREAEVARVCSLVEAGRLVTLTGPGGVGKTRLALAAADRLARSGSEVCEDGVWLVELAGLTGRLGDGGGERGGATSDLAGTVAAVLGVRDDVPQGQGQGQGQGQSGSGVSVVDLLAEALSTRRMLLVLDNCEHIVGPVADLVEQLLRRAPQLRVLATSQEPLALSGEVLDSVDPLAQTEAMELFAARAAAAAPGFTLDADNAEAVALICRRLDGIPLALELAATRVRALGVQALAERLHDRFRLLNQVRRDAPARQRTLRAMIDWSWELLPPAEQLVLRRLAVFSGGFTLEAGEAVGAGGPIPGGGDGRGAAYAVDVEEAAYETGVQEDAYETGVQEDGDVLDTVTRLVDRSLLVAAPGPDGVRYRMLESIAAYSLERLAEAGEAEAARRRHALHYAELAERAEPHLHGRDQQRWLRRLDDEALNLRAALDHSLADGSTDLALRLVNADAWYWYLRGRIGEGARSLQLAIEGAEAMRSTPAYAAARTKQAAFALLTGDASRLGVDFTDADARSRWLLALARCGFDNELDQGGPGDPLNRLCEEFQTLGDRWGEAAALSLTATRALYRGDLPALRENAERSAAHFAELCDRWGQLQAAEQLGVLAEIAGDYEEAARLHREGARGAEELQLWTHAAYFLARLGRIALLTGDEARATEFHGRAAKLAAEQSHQPAQQFAETGLALGARRRGDLDEAERLLRPWLDWNRRLGVVTGEALVLAQLGYVAEQRGDVTRAEALHEAGLAAARRTGDPRALALALEGLAGAYTAGDRPAQGAELLGRAAALRETVGSPLPKGERWDVRRAEGRARRALGEDAFEEALARGRTSRDA
ncbi:BTAD domain-containing putative transcriptional regulator [Streptomyces sp. NBC_01304]|uniref:BTAD domain-containing putative transcriptional regulator n=1 Tax=Streptomyces sp. NBC_01304 TaxID=2903818 RepID=UPI002E137DDC|nr:winged helix-turn-helix domain-containing protein [Streptomyces sp. NBC_01304]